MSSTQPFREPLRATLVRTVLIAIVAGAGLAAWSARSSHPIPWPVGVVLMLWLSFGGHWVELWYLNWLRPRLLPDTRTMLVVTRLGTWLVGGCWLGFGMILTARALMPAAPVRWSASSYVGIIFVVVELIVHSALRARGRPSFFNGRG